MIDTHCHLDFNAYAEDRAQVIERAAQADVDRIINPGTNFETSRTAVSLAADNTGVYAAVGIHPNSSADYSESWLQDIVELARAKKVVAIGEIGLDYYWDKSPKASQIAAFEAQLAVAARLELPVIIHNREASSDVMAILESWAADLPASLKSRPGVLHSFSAPAETAERALKAGFYLGFTGPITYKKADDLRRIAATVPLDRIVVETDGPFLRPMPRRDLRNEPALIPLIVERLAALKQISFETMARITTENAERLFALDL